MTDGHRDALKAFAGNGVRFDVPMDRETTFRAGGRAWALYQAEEPEELSRVIRYLHDEGIPYRALGRGSNLLVADEGFPGVFVRLGGKLANISLVDDARVLAGGGAGLQNLVRFCTDQGLAGLEFLSGIPGSVGGAVAMNAGAFGWDMGSRVRAIHWMTPAGDRRWEDASTRLFAYRQLLMPEGTLILEAALHVDREAPQVIGARVAENLKRRGERQPRDYPSAGSVFKNPAGDYAARLIEGAGLKGKAIGGAMVSFKHANFIVNTGQATASDILALISLIQTEVLKQTSVWLEPEIHVVGS